MELELGMYVRTEYGISKIINIFPEKGATFIETDNGLGNCSMSSIRLPGGLHKGIYLLEEDYEMFIENNVKSTIIDLIEVGDYVNGKQVEWVGYDLYKEHNNGTLEGIGEKRVLFNSFTKDSVRQSGIKSIVTSQQFESMSYKVGE